MIKPFVGTLSLLAIMSAPAMAADMRARPLPPPVLATTWTGCHIGGAVGTASGISPGYSSTAATTVGVFPGVTVIPAGTQVSGRMYMTGLTGGAYGGCDIQFGTWVVGVEGDWMANNKEGQAHATILVPGAGAGAIWSLKERWYATARGRLGYAVDKWLFYVTGGAAWMKLDSAEFVVSPTAAVLNPVSSAVLQSDLRTGWTVGAGVEYALPYNWSIRSEYLYIKIPSYTTFTPGVGSGLIAGMPRNLSTEVNNQIFRAGLTYRFGGWGKAPVVTK